MNRWLRLAISHLNLKWENSLRRSSKKFSIFLIKLVISPLMVLVVWFVDSRYRQGSCIASWVRIKWIPKWICESFYASKWERCLHTKCGRKTYARCLAHENCLNCKLKLMEIRSNILRWSYMHVSYLIWFWHVLECRLNLYTCRCRFGTPSCAISRCGSSKRTHTHRLSIYAIHSIHYSISIINSLCTEEMMNESRLTNRTTIFIALHTRRFVEIV